ncbi:MAG TPA: hypothetical protein VKN18_01625 [Blastocatellia bacterium]|nr:hypothetical protein [Blastocatellia bacterium]
MAKAAMGRYARKLPNTKFARTRPSALGHRMGHHAPNSRQLGGEQTPHLIFFNLSRIRN